MSAFELGSVPEALASIRTRHLFAFRLKIREMILIGPATGVTRRIGIIAGGVFEGERLRGEILDSGNDFQTLRTDTVTNVDVRMILRTDDNALIAARYTGVRADSPDVVQRLSKGMPVAADEYYLRISALFETSAPKYEWLNTIVSVGAGHREASGPIYNLFEVA